MLSPFFTASCSLFKLDKESNCLNDKASCFKSDKTAPQMAVGGDVYPKQDQLVSVLNYIDVMFSEELNNPQPADFSLTGAGQDLEVSSVQYLSGYTYRLMVTQRALVSGNIYLNFPNLKDYNGNKITGTTTIRYIGNIDIPITVPSVDAIGAAIVNPTHGGISGGTGYGTLDISWYYSYTPPAASPGTTVYSVKRTTGSQDCKDPAAVDISGLLVSPSPAAGTVTAYDGTDATTRANTTHKFTLSKVNAALPYPGSAISYTVLICVDNDQNNKHGKVALNIVRADSTPTTTLGQAPGAFAAPKTLAFSCSPFADKIAINTFATTDNATDPTGSVALPSFNATTGAITSGTQYDSASPWQTTYTTDPTWSAYKFSCIDQAGNIEAVKTKSIYKIDSRFPSVTISNIYKSGTTVPVTGASTAVGAYNNIDIVWKTNIANTNWELRIDGAACGSGSPYLQSPPQPATPAIANSLVTTTVAASALATGNNQITLCVYSSGVSAWGQDSVNVIRDDSAPTISFNIGAGSYGSQQSIVPTCSTNGDKIIYSVASLAGGTAPTAPAAPTFDANGQLATGSLFGAPLVPQDGYSTTYVFRCINKAGVVNAAPVTATYKIDSVLPTISIVSNSLDYLSNVIGYTTTSLVWQSSRGGLSYQIQRGGTTCNGTNLTPPPGTNLSGTTPADTSQMITTTIDKANLNAGTDGSYSIQICVQNFIGQYGYTSKTLVVDTVLPTFAGLVTLTNPGDGTATLGWGVASDASAGIAGYDICQSTVASPGVGSCQASFVATYQTGAAANGITLSGLNTATVYYFMVKTRDNAGNRDTNTVEKKSRLNLGILTAGYGGAGTLQIQVNGAEILPISANGTQAFATGFNGGASYSLAITGQPTGQNCAFTQNQYGTLNADVTLNVTCTPGYISSGNMTVNPPVPLNYHLYRGNAIIIAGGGAGGTACPGVGATCKDGTGLQAQFNNPHGMVMVNGIIYIAEQSNNRVRKLDTATNVVSTFAGDGSAASADGTGTSARLNSPQGITSDGGNLYVIESASGLLRRIVIATQAVTTIAGAGNAGGSTCPGTVTAGCKDGVGQQATFVGPNDVTYHNGYLYISEYSGSRVRRMDLSTGQVVTIAGDGSATGSADGNGTSATFFNVTGGAIVGNDLYVADYNGNKIRKINLVAPYTVTTVAGSALGYADGPAGTAKFSNPDHLATDGTNLFIGEYTGNRIRRFDTRTNIVSTLAGDGTAASFAGIGVAAQINQPVGVVSDGAKLYAAAWAGNQVFRISDSGLVAYWPLNGTPTDYNSAGSAANNLTPAGGLSTATGRYGGTDVAYRFDGTASLSTAANPTSLGLSSDYSISVWVNPNSTSGMRIVDKITSGGCDGYLVDFLPGNQVRFSYCIGGSGEVRSGVLVPTGQWTHIVATFSSSRRRARLYINGRLDAEVQTAVGTTQTNALPVRIGVDSAGNNKFSGAMAAVRLYDRLLSEGEINELAQDAGGTASVGSGYNTGATGLLAHFDYTNTSAASLGPIGGTMTPLCSNPIGKDGDAGGSCYLDGSTNMSANGKSIGAPSGNAPRTLCIWFKPASLPVNKVLLAHGNPNAPSQRGFGMTLLSSTQAQLWSWGGPTVNFNYNTQLNTWQHLCGTLSGSTVQMFANGQLIGTDTGTISAANTVNDAGSVLSMGSNLDGNTSLIFNGTLDDARIYNNVLSAGQIRQLATQVPAGLVLHLDTIGDATDVSGSGQNFISNSGSPAPGRTGAANTAYRFTNGQIITIGDHADLNPSMDASWTFWMKSPSISSLSTEIFGKYTGVNGWIFKYDQSNYMHGWTYASTATGAQTNSYRVPSDNIWNHYAFVRSGSTMTIYLNGASVSNVQVGNGLALLPGNVNLKFGNFGVGDLTAQDARLYSRALSAAEVRSLSGYSLQQVTTWSGASAASSLKFQLAADSLSNLGGGTNVGTWLDTSGQGNHVSAPGAQPVFQTNVFGNAPGVRFSSSLMNRTASLTGFNTTLDSTFFIVLARSSNGTHHLFNVGQNAAGCNSNRQYIVYGPSPNTHVDIEHEGCNGNSSNSFPTTSNAELHAIMLDGSSNTNFYINGAGNGGNNPGWGGFSAPSVLTIGGIPSSPTGTLAGIVGEMLYFNTPLTATSVYGSITDRVIVECYLSAKYSIALTTGVACP